jgi:hypothetical protein
VISAQRVRFVVLGCALTAVLAAGCSQKGGGAYGKTGARVSGRLLNNGQPVKPQPGEDIIVSFNLPGTTDPLAPRGSSPIDPKDGSFAFASPTGNVGLLPPGQYRVTISSQLGGGTEGKNRFSPTFDQDRTPLVADVGPEAEQTFVIDISKKTVTKQ